MKRPFLGQHAFLYQTEVFSYPNNFSYFDMQVNFVILPISRFQRWLGEFFSLYQSYEFSII